MDYTILDTNYRLAIDNFERVRYVVVYYSNYALNDLGIKSKLVIKNTKV